MPGLAQRRRGTVQSRRSRQHGGAPASRGSTAHSGHGNAHRHPDGASADTAVRRPLKSRQALVAAAPYAQPVARGITAESSITGGRRNGAGPPSRARGGAVQASRRRGGGGASADEHEVIEAPAGELPVQLQGSVTAALARGKPPAFVKRQPRDKRAPTYARAISVYKNTLPGGEILPPAPVGRGSVTQQANQASVLVGVNTIGAEKGKTWQSPPQSRAGGSRTGRRRSIHDDNVDERDVRRKSHAAMAGGARVVGNARRGAGASSRVPGPTPHRRTASAMGSRRVDAVRAEHEAGAKDIARSPTAPASLRRRQRADTLEGGRGGDRTGASGVRLHDELSRDHPRAATDAWSAPSPAEGSAGHANNQQQQGQQQGQKGQGQLVGEHFAGVPTWYDDSWLQGADSAGGVPSAADGAAAPVAEVPLHHTGAGTTQHELGDASRGSTAGGSSRAPALRERNRRHGDGSRPLRPLVAREEYRLRGFKTITYLADSHGGANQFAPATPSEAEVVGPSNVGVSKQGHLVLEFADVEPAPGGRHRGAGTRPMPADDWEEEDLRLERVHRQRAARQWRARSPPTDLGSYDDEDLYGSGEEHDAAGGYAFPVRKRSPKRSRRRKGHHLTSALERTAHAEGEGEGGGAGVGAEAPDDESVTQSESEGSESDSGTGSESGSEAAGSRHGSDSDNVSEFSEDRREREEAERAEQERLAAEAAAAAERERKEREKREWDALVNKSATSIQAVYRGRASRQEMAQQHKAAASLQRSERGRQRRAHARHSRRRLHERREQSTTKIQSLRRGAVGRRKAAERRTELNRRQAASKIFFWWVWSNRRSRYRAHESATKIQSIARAFHAERYVATLRRERYIHFWKATQLAQRVGRGALARARAKRERAARKLQAVARGYAGRKVAGQLRYERDYARALQVYMASVRKVQRVVRGMLARKRVAAIRHHRARRERRLYQRMWDNAVEIQRVWRGTMARMEAYDRYEEFLAAQVLQCAWRSARARRELQRRKWRVARAQSAGRRRRAFNYMWYCAVDIQRIGRGVIARRRVATMRARREALTFGMW